MGRCPFVVSLSNRERTCDTVPRKRKRLRARLKSGAKGMDAFRVIHPGILTTYQDLGRPGVRQFGITVSGAMDTIALRVANLLVGNKESAVGLEITLMGLKMVALSATLIAVTGADLYFTINSEYQPSWKRHSLKEGDTVHFG